MAWSKQKVRLTMAIVLVMGFFGLIGTMLFFPVPSSNADIIKVLVGFVGGAFVTMIAFYFGDSEGS